jgi:hypothetical protein
MRARVAFWAALLSAAAWPLADVAAANGVTEMPLREATVWFSGIVLVLLILVFIGRRGCGSYSRAAAIVTPLGLLFFSYAIVSPTLQAISGGYQSRIGAFSLFLLIFSGIGFWLFRATRDASSTRFLLWVAPLLLASTCGLVAVQALGAHRATVTRATNVHFAQRPNVYHFLFDGMGRQEVIRGKLGVDVGDATAAFRSLGFVVPEGVRAQYPTTWQSINSFMNLGVTDGRIEQPDIASSSVVRGFRSNSYSFVRYGEVFRFSACTGQEDKCLSSKTPGLSEFSVTMLKRTPIFTLGRRLVLSRTSSRHLTQNLKGIAAARITRPSYIFTYMVPPHPPFIFSSSCVADQKDFNDFRAWRRASAPRYAIAYRCVVAAASAAIAQIISKDPSAIIIVSGDHGTMFGQVGQWRDGWTPGVLEERLPVFLAVRAPAACSDLLLRIRRLADTYPAVFSCLSRSAGGSL